MYTIQHTSFNGIYKATLYFKFPWDELQEEKECKANADFSVLLDEIKSWNKYLKLN